MTIIFNKIDNNIEIINVTSIRAIHLKNVDSPAIIIGVTLCSTFICNIYTIKEYNQLWFQIEFAD